MMKSVNSYANLDDGNLPSTGSAMIGAQPLRKRLGTVRRFQARGLVRPLVVL